MQALSYNAILEDFSGKIWMYSQTSPAGNREVSPVAGFGFYDQTQDLYTKISSEVANLSRFLDSNRPFYVFLNPKYCDDLREPARSSKLNAIFDQVCDEARI
jgi:hypothetical protein